MVVLSDRNLIIHALNVFKKNQLWELNASFHSATSQEGIPIFETHKLLYRGTFNGTH